MSTIKEIQVPDIGDFEDVEVIEIMVSPGDNVSIEDPLITLESDKATMEIPAPFAGVVKEIKVKEGDRVSEGTIIAMLEIEGERKSENTEKVTKPAVEEAAPDAKSSEPVSLSKPVDSEPPQNNYSGHPHPSEAVNTSRLNFHAGPSTRKKARELGVDLSKVAGSGRRGRITLEDVENFVKKSADQKEEKKEGLNIPPAPTIDFGKFGEIELKAMKRIQKISARNLHRNWIAIPHVTHFDEADITDLEDFRKSHNSGVKEKIDRLTLMPFLYKAIVSGLKVYPVMNSSLDPDGENLILKKYFHIGMAVDTNNGLLVPVIKDVDQKTLLELSHNMSEITLKAREGRIKLEDMQGGCFTISNLGGIGGTGFTPIVNAPEVAILGVPRAAIKPIFQNGEFVPRLILPLSLSYDHRVVDGALAARFLAHVCEMLTDIRKML